MVTFDYSKLELQILASISGNQEFKDHLNTCARCFYNMSDLCPEALRIIDKN